MGIEFQSLDECEKALKAPGTPWILQDKSLMIQEDKDLTLTFCPGTHLERRLVLAGEELQTFKHAIHFLSLASAPQKN